MNFNKGINAIKGCKMKSAIKFFNLAIENNENMIASHIELGKCYSIIREFKQSEKCFLYANMLLNNTNYEECPFTNSDFIAFARVISINKITLYNQLDEEVLLKKELVVFRNLIENNIFPKTFLNPIRD